MPTQVLAQPSKQQRPQPGQSRSDTPTDQQLLWRPRQEAGLRGEAGGQMVGPLGRWRAAVTATGAGCRISSCTRTFFVPSYGIILHNES